VIYEIGDINDATLDHSRYDPEVKERKNTAAASLRLTSKLIYDEWIEYILHRKRSTREYPINTDAPKGEIFKIRMHI